MWGIRGNVLQKVHKLLDGECCIHHVDSRMNINHHHKHLWTFSWQENGRNEIDKNSTNRFPYYATHTPAWINIQGQDPPCVLLVHYSQAECLTKAIDFKILAQVMIRFTRFWSKQSHKCSCTLVCTSHLLTTLWIYPSVTAHFQG